MSLAVLLQAAEYIERKEREMEHGYAITLPMPESLCSNRHSSSPSNSSTKSQRSRRTKSKIHNNRTTHNELEKNRRAHLRTCLEKLKDKVPLGPDGARHTTLGLLTRAKHFIKNLEDRDRKNCSQKDTLQREQRHLRRRLEHLDSHLDYTSKRRSVSESSAFSTESSSTSSATSESDEVDILGYGSNQSDTDDHSSIQSSSSDGGVTIFTRRLTLGDSSPVLPSYQQQAL